MFFLSHIFFGERSVWKIFELKSQILNSQEEYALLVAKKNNVFLIKREKIFCYIDLKRCPSLTEEGHKIYYDNVHITDSGAEFFARIIEKDKLFLKYLYSALNLSPN